MTRVIGHRIGKDGIIALGGSLAVHALAAGLAFSLGPSRDTLPPPLLIELQEPVTPSVPSAPPAPPPRPAPSPGPSHAGTRRVPEWAVPPPSVREQPPAPSRPATPATEPEVRTPLRVAEPALQIPGPARVAEPAPQTPTSASAPESASPARPGPAAVTPRAATAPPAGGSVDAEDARSVGRRGERGEAPVIAAAPGAEGSGPASGEPSRGAPTEANRDGESERVAGEPIPMALAVGGGGRASTEYDAYLAALRQRVHEALTYPWSARRRGLAGTVLLEIEVLPTGAVRAVGVVASSSHAVLDDAAVAAVGAVSPLPFPSGLRRRVLRVRLPVVFQLQGAR